MPVLQASGIGSGLDVAGLVSQLVAAERTPVENRLNARESTLNSQLSAWGKVTSALDSLQTALSNLTSATAFQQRSTTSSNSTVATATATTSAALGNHSLTVSTLAKAQKLAGSTGFANTTDVVGSGTLTIEVGTYNSGTDTYTASTTTNLTITAGVDDSLASIRDKINNAGIGVTASIVNDGTNNYLTFSSDNTGTANTVRISTTDNDGNNTDNAGLSQLVYDPTTAGVKNLSQTQAAQDATFNLDGINITSSSNTVSTALTGVTFDLLSAGSTTITVGADTTSAKDTITQFVDAYNSVIKAINTASKYKEGADSQGPLLSDSMVRNLKTSLQTIVGDVSSNGGVFSTLTELGYATDPTDGTLTLKDSAKLDSALSSNFNDVGSLVSDIATSVDNYISPYLGTTGMIQSRTDGLDSQLSDIADARDRLDYRISLIKDRYTRQFSALDTLISNMNSTMDFLSQQLASLPGAKG